MRLVRPLGLGQADGRDAEDPVGLDGEEELLGAAGGVPLAGAPVGLHEPRDVGLRQLRREPLHEPRLVQAAGAGVQHAEELPLVARGAGQQRHVRGLPGGDGVERRLGKRVAVHQRLEGQQAQRGPELENRLLLGLEQLVGRKLRAAWPGASAGAMPSSSRKRAATFVAVSRVWTLWLAPLWAMARAKSPRADGIPSSVPTLMPPADSPKIVTLSGIAAEGRDVVAHPLERRHLVADARVARGARRAPGRGPPGRGSPAGRAGS